MWGVKMWRQKKAKENWKFKTDFLHVTVPFPSHKSFRVYSLHLFFGGDKTKKMILWETNGN